MAPVHLVAATLVLAGHGLAAQQDAAPVLRVLFLGDRGHHAPAERAQQLLAPLAARGIDLCFADRLEILEPAQLAPYDALLVYANWPALGRARERALLDFVAGGKGLVAVHCASACFADSPAWTALLGAQFERHGTGVFTPRWLLPDHPILAGLEPFTSWDETYVHRRHASDRTLLAVRGDGPDAEPWSWVRTHGSGRVFYTASGHDARTWREPGFQELLARGIRWAAGDDAPARACVRSPLPQIQSPSPVPDYAAGRPWGESTTHDRMQPPLPPDESRARAVVPPGLELRPFASEPEIRKPIALTWDARGRLWLAETIDYPNERAEDGHGRDRIRICEDQDGDGRADRFTTFADGLSLPTSLVLAGGGCIVTAPPDVWLLIDRDGDDRCDERRLLFTGFGTGDTHAGPSQLRYGFDNWIWGTCGYAGFRGTVGGERHRFGQGLFRFRPDGSRLEFVASTNNNTWGLGFSEEADVFASTANGNPSVALVIPNRHYEVVTGFAPGALPAIAESTRIHPITRHVRQVDFHGQFTAGAGHALYTARLLPPPYWNRAAFVCEPTGHLIGRLWLEPQGATFVARDGWNLLASDDEWTAPVVAEVGPDGAVWIADWYNFIVQHNPTPQGFATGKGSAYETPLRDKTHGRILRLVPRGAAVPKVDLSRAEPAALVEALRADALAVRLTAQRLLVERGGREPVAALCARIRTPDRDALGLDPGALHALWALDGLGCFARGEPEPLAAARGALQHPVAGVRRAALQLLPRDGELVAAIRASGLLADPDPRVRVAALLALADAAPSRELGAEILATLQVPENARDRWVSDAATIAAARHDAGFLAAVVASARPAAGAPAAPAELLPNPGFERLDGTGVAGWQPRHYGGQAQSSVDAPGRGGGHALELRSDRGADTSFCAAVEVEPDATYRLSGWIRTEAVTSRGGRGAQLNVHEIQGAQNARTGALTGTRDWTQVAVTFDSGAHRRLTINCLLGGWGLASGRAWFDDLSLVRVDRALPGRLGQIVARVTAHYAARAPADPFGDLLAGLEAADTRVAAELLDTLAEGWPVDRPPQLDDDARAKLARFATTLRGPAQAGLLALAMRWGDPEWVQPARAAVLADLRSALASDALPFDERVGAAARLRRLADGEAAIEAILAVLHPGTDPAFAGRLLDVVATSRDPETGGRILARLDRLAPATRRAALGILLRREPWCTALLDRLEHGAGGAELPAELRLQLETHPVAAIAARAQALRAAAGDRAEVVRRITAELPAGGDVARGRALYAANCAACHQLGGTGGLLGPALDRIGERPPDELLIAILDPNRSIEDNYRLWTVATRDGRSFAGRVVGETRRAIRLLDLSGTEHELPRGELDSLQQTPMSLMPATFEHLRADGLADLLAFLAAQR